MALGKSRVRMNAKAKGLLFKIEELASGGSTITMSDVGYVESVRIGDDHGMVEIADATGDLINELSTKRTCRLEVVLLQTAKDELDVLANAESKFYHAYIQVQLDNPTVYYQEWYFPLVKVRAGYDLTFRSGEVRKVTLNIAVLMPKGAVDVTPNGFDVSAGTLFVMAETATTALGQVTTANGTVYTAAV